MAHKTLINGTAYEITGGRTLVNGTGYSIASGKTMVGGTVYEVGFAKPVTITVTGTGLDGYVDITHNGTKYSSATTFTANVGDTIRCRCVECYGGYPTTYIRVNNLTMVYTNEDDDISYEYTVVSDATINLYVNGASEKRERVGQIDITEIPEGYTTVTITGIPSYSTSFGSYYIYYYENDGAFTNLGNGTYVLPIGQTVEFILRLNKGYSGTITIDGETVASGSDSDVLYLYTLAGNINVRCYSRGSTTGDIEITTT